MKRSFLGNVVRGGLIGVVETVPGVSGGTVALVVGIYDEIINSIGHLVSAFRKLLFGPERIAGFKEEFRQADWKTLIPVGIGMIAALATVAGPMSDTVANHPEIMRAIFFGLVLGSIWVPIRLSGGGWKIRDWIAMLVAAGAAFWLLSLKPAQIEPTPFTIVLSAAIAVSALLLPGLSGSFLLLIMGMYHPTLQAVGDRDLAYIGLFGLGMVIGMVIIVKGLQWLLKNHHRITMVVLVGILLGALRTLWPWQGTEGELLAPASNWPLLLALTLAALVVVGVALYADFRITRRGEGVRHELESVIQEQKD